MLISCPYPKESVANIIRSPTTAIIPILEIPESTYSKSSCCCICILHPAFSASKYFISLLTVSQYFSSSTMLFKIFFISSSFLFICENCLSLSFDIDLPKSLRSFSSTTTFLALCLIASNCLCGRFSSFWISLR